METQRRFWGRFILISGIVLLAATLLYSPISQAVPTITWTPESVTESIAPGQSKTISVSFTATKNISNVVVRVVPELQPFVQTNPTTFANIVKDQTNTLNLILSAAAPARLILSKSEYQMVLRFLSLTAFKQGPGHLLIFEKLISRLVPVRVFKWEWEIDHANIS